MKPPSPDQRALGSLPLSPDGAAARISPARRAGLGRPRLLDGYLRQLPHDQTVIEFTGVTNADLAIAVHRRFQLAGSLRGPRRRRSRGVLWRAAQLPPGRLLGAEMVGRGPRAKSAMPKCCKAGEAPPLLLNLVWADYAGWPRRSQPRMRADDAYSLSMRSISHRLDGSRGMFSWVTRTGPKGGKLPRHRLGGHAPMTASDAICYASLFPMPAHKIR